jgi:hypothetical protein
MALKKKTLDVWPIFPIVIEQYGYSKSGEDDTIAAPEHNGCICEINLWNFFFFFLNSNTFHWVALVRT